MNFVLERIEDPDGELVTLAAMKTHLKLFASDTSQDNDVSELITAAREWAEDFTGRALMEQTWRLNFGEKLRFDPLSRYCGAFRVRDNGIYLRRSPALEITRFVSVDGAGTETDIDAENYQLVEQLSKWPRVLGLNGMAWNAGQYRVEFKAGFTDDQPPVRFIRAMKLWAEAHYDRDSNMADLIQTAENMLRPERTELSLA